jgi:cell division protein FtsZ
MVKSKMIDERSRLTKIASKNTLDSEYNQIVVLGIGGAGSNAVNQLMEIGILGVKCIAIDTDQQHLNTVQACQKLLIGEKVTRGLGAVGKFNVGRIAVKESKVLIEDLLEGIEVAFITAGLGGGTGTGAAPIVAEIARLKGAITVGIVTTPLNVEEENVTHAVCALNDIRRVCHTVAVIDSSKLIGSVSNLPKSELFKIANQISANTIKVIVERISAPELMNHDFEDFKTMMQKRGLVMVRTSESIASNKADETVRNAFNDPVLNEYCAEVSGSSVEVTVDTNLKLVANRAGSIVSDILCPDSLVKCNAKKSPTLNEIPKVTPVMTEFSSPKKLSGFAALMPKMYNMESSYSEPEKRLHINLSLDQIESLEE